MSAHLVSNRASPSESTAAPIVPVWSEPDKARLFAYVERWAAIFHLDKHHINIIFSETAKPGDDSPAADMSDNHPYESDHALTFYPSLLKFTSPEEQERAVVHELCHLPMALVKNLLWQVLVKEKLVTWREVKEQNERATDWIANIIFGLAGPTPPSSPPVPPVAPSAEPPATPPAAPLAAPPA